MVSPESGRYRGADGAVPTRRNDVTWRRGLFTLQGVAPRGSGALSLETPPRESGRTRRRSNRALDDL